MFLTTANTMSLPRPLLDRMEIIRLAGYTEQEKFEIGKRHLLDKQRKAHGLTEKEFALGDDAMTGLIRYYTRESGPRRGKGPDWRYDRSGMDRSGR